MDNLSIEQLEQAQTQLITRTSQARGDLDYLTRDQSRLIIGNVLGVVTHDEVKATRQLIAECLRTLEETPPALALIKELIAQLRSQEAQRQRGEEAEQTLLDYFSARQEIIDKPDLAGKRPGGRLRGLASQADRDVSNGRTEKREVPFASECEALITAAMEHNKRNRSEPFSFDVLITE